MRKILKKFLIIYSFFFLLGFFGNFYVFAANSMLPCSSIETATNNEVPCDENNVVSTGNVCDACDPKETGSCEKNLQCINKQCQNPTNLILCSSSVHDTPEKLINEILKWIFILSLVVAPLLIILGGFYVLTAAGDIVRVTQGKKIITWALIGLGVILSAKAFFAIITFFLK